MPVKDYNADPDLNTQISGINIAEGCAPSGINDAIRQLMADVKEESEAQAKAVGEASTQLSSLDSALRSLIAEEVAKCLKTSGGTMSGCLYFERGLLQGPSGTYAGLELNGNKENPSGGATFVARAPDAASDPNAAVMIARSPGTYHDLKLTADGVLTKDGQQVLTSAGGIIQGELLVRNCADFIRREVNNDRLVFLGGPHWERCAFIELFGGDNGGRVQLNAKDGSNHAALAVYPNGLATIAGCPIPYLVASWRSGPNGYRKYSDGFIEQWGEVTPAVDVSFVGFHIPFSDMNYFVTVSQYRTTDSDKVSNAVRGSTTGFNLYVDENTAHGWHACGY